MGYRCLFPGCSVVSDIRGTMDDHHIVAKSDGGPDAYFNRLLVCPSCHRKIYIPGISSGHHKIARYEGIVIFGKVYTSSGHALRYARCSDGVERLMFLNSGEIIVDEDRLQTDLFDPSTSVEYLPRRRDRSTVWDSIQ